MTHPIDSRIVHIWQASKSKSYLFYALGFKVQNVFQDGMGNHVKLQRNHLPKRYHPLFEFESEENRKY